MNIQKFNRDLTKLSQGEHSLGEVLKMAGLKKEDKNVCPECGTELIVSREQLAFAPDKFQDIAECLGCGYTESY